MSLKDSIDGIYARNDLSQKEKNHRSYQLKGQAHLDSLVTLGSSKFTIGNLEITLTKPPIYDGQKLIVWVSAKRNGVPIVFPVTALPFIYINPPIIHNGSEDPLEASKQMIADTVKRF